MTATVSGDTQLWLIQLDDWTVPLLAVPVSLEGPVAAFDVRAGVMLGVSQHNALAGRLSAACYFESSAGWVVGKETLSKMAEKAPGITPAYYHRKLGDEAVKETVEIAEVEPQFNPAQETGREPASSFPEFCWRETGGELAMYKFYWNIFAKHVARWLVGEMQEIDMGWLKLRALPVRDNWKQILLAKFPDLAAAKDMGAGELEAFLDSRPFMSQYLYTDLIKLHGEHHNRVVGWTPEVETTPHWDKYALETEVERVRFLRASAYPTWWGAVMKGLKPYAMSVLLRFCSQTNLPAASFGSLHNQRTSAFVEHVDDTRIKPVRVDDVPVHVGGNHGRLAVRAPGSGKSVPLSYEDLQEMPVVRLAPPKVRGRKKYLGGQRPA